MRIDMGASCSDQGTPRCTDLEMGRGPLQKYLRPAVSGLHANYLGPNWRRTPIAPYQKDDGLYGTFSGFPCCLGTVQLFVGLQALPGSNPHRQPKPQILNPEP